MDRIEIRLLPENDSFDSLLKETFLPSKVIKYQLVASTVHTNLFFVHAVVS